MACYEQALRLQPDFAEAYNNLGVVRARQGKLNEAIACYEQALQLRPDYAEASNNLGNSLENRGQYDEALACYEQALRLRPDYAEAYWNRTLAWLLRGDWDRGWPAYEERWRYKKVFTPRPFPQPRWDGSPLNRRTILLHYEQGLGDTLQFIRYAPLVHQRGGRVIVECQPALVPVLARCPGIEQLVAYGLALPAFDVHASLMSLPAIFGTILTTVPDQVPYVFADPELSQYWRAELQPFTGFKVGIAWQGNPNYQNDYYRSLPLAAFEPLAHLPWVQLFSLQKGAGAEQVQTLAGRFSVIDLGKRLDATAGAFMDTAAVMQQLDLVIAPDTAIAHLAGALGVPVWVPLPLAPNWRWLLHRADSPWYPTARLFRQSRVDHWDDVFAHMAAELEICLSRS